MTSEFVCYNAATAAVFGFFAPGWFGWAQEKPPTSWRNALAVSSIVSLLIAVAGGILAWRHWEDGIEFALAGVGGLVLAMRRRMDIIPTWIGLVVGAFVSLARHRGLAVSAVTGPSLGQSSCSLRCSRSPLFSNDVRDCGADAYAGLDSWCGASASCSWMRELISSLANTFRRCHSTVRGLR